ncbi:uncharacterized protein TNCV_1554741 [Trichonephila clavipes]|nr:uncharacterized protein TNCV_1554741 [Trichonephila clavipes]
MMIPAYNKKRCAAFPSRRESITGERPTSFPKKIQPCLTRDSNPLGYKPSVIATLLAGRQKAISNSENNAKTLSMGQKLRSWTLND